LLGLAVTPDASPRLSAPEERKLVRAPEGQDRLASAAEVDDEVKALLKAAWEKS
jgi:hypothetical protein